MHRKLLTVVNALVILVFTIMLAAPAAQVSADGPSFMPPNPEKILSSLIKQGVISASASIAEKEAALQSYLQKKLAVNMDKEANPRARKQVDANETALNGSPSDIRGKKLGNTVSVPPSSPQYKPLQGADKLLLILVDFSNQSYTWTTADGQERSAAGPLHNQIPVPDNDFDLWVPDFSQKHFEDMLFTPGGFTFPEGTPYYAGQHRGSMHDYYLEQSYGEYTVDGQAYGWFQVDKPEAYYGDDDPDVSHDDLLPGTTKDLIADAVEVINSQNAINWAEYDTNGDCVIDHPLFIHAGVDQSGGGGAQGDDALWAHSSSTWAKVAEATCSNGLDGIYISNYTLMPEDGGVGVFAHEFGHDLGLPDEYDTIYSGAGASTAFWSIMSSGSWVGRPAQTQPPDMSMWARLVLGWAVPGKNLGVVSFNDLTKTATGVRLEQAERWGGEGTYNGVRVNLPPKYFFINEPFSGTSEWFGGRGDELDTTLTRTVDLSGKTSAQLSFATWYQIEENWDYAFVQVSEDAGATWSSLPIAGTTSDAVPGAYPTIPDALPGFTGDSDGWQQKSFDLAAYAGKTIQLRFRYITDWGTNLAGFYVDDISVTADGAAVFSDDAESLDAAWTAAGWTRDAGGGYKNHYYLLEWRNLKAFETVLDGASRVNFDNGLTNVYQADSYAVNPNQPKYYSYAPGLLVWYRDMTVATGDNWTGAHPGSGYLLVVDANPRPLMRPSLPGLGSIVWNNRVQVYDATFSLTKPPTVTLNWAQKTQTIGGQTAVPNFTDSQSYWSNKIPDNSAVISKYGLLFRVLGQAKDGSAAVIGLGK